MCFYKLDVCPYPHEDPVRALIFDPAKDAEWEICDIPQPWGRLSCGSLVVEHPTITSASEEISNIEHIEDVLTTRSNIPDEKGCSKGVTISVRSRRSSSDCTITPASVTALGTHGTACPWCTLIIKLAATKSKQLQKELRLKIAELETKMDTNHELRRMQQDIMNKAKEMYDMRSKAWNEILSTIAGKD